MINGLKVTIAGSELISICKKRAEYHEDRAATYAEQVQRMQADAIEGAQYTNGNPIQALKERQAKHEGDHGEMLFIAEHLVASESYLLDREDLVKIGVTKSRY